MDRRTARRLVLPATLAVTTFISANSCKQYEEYCIDIETMAECEAADGCGWSEQFNECLNTCDQIPTQAECEAVERCEWSEGFGDTGGTGDTGGGESCHEPFT